MSRVTLSRFAGPLVIGIVLAVVQACDKNDPVEPTPETAIRGKVTDTNTSAPVESVEVWISPPGTTMVYTNGFGEYGIARLAPGSYELFVMKRFYEIESRTVTVKKEQTTSASFAIEEIVDDNQFDFWGKFRWHHYYVSKAAWQWTQARLLSIAQSGYMVTIADASEDSVVHEIAKSVAQYVAIGFTDEVQEGIWVWVTGESSAYRHWTPGEPNNANNEDYGQLFYTTGQWNDYPGTALFRFVLEIE